MTWEEMHKFMHEQLLDEIDDSNKYYKMAVEASRMDCKELADGFNEISKEEFTHGKFLHDNLIKYGYEIPPELELKWHILEERIKIMGR